MTQQATQPAVGGDDHVVAADLTPEDRLNAAFDDPANHQDDPNQPPADDGNDPDAQPPADDDLDDDLDDKAQDDDLPPIDAPVSWDADAKAKFAELPRDVQEYVAKREGEREKFVQSKSQEATRAKAEAEQAAYQQLAEYDAKVSQRLHSLAEQLQPQRPNPQLLQYDPQAFYAQQAQYEADVAQQRELQQQADDHARQAHARAQEIERHTLAEQHRLIVETFPEYADPTTGPELQRKLTSVAKELGYPDELIGQARASDILAMRTAADWKAKAEKYDALQAKRMEKVRAAKGKPPVTTKPGTAQAPGAVRGQQYAADREALRQGDLGATQRVLDSYFTKSK